VQQGEESCAVDGKAVRLRNVSRARTRKAGLATLELGRGHGRSLGETVSVTGLGGADYNIEGAVLSDVTATSIAWPSPGPDEAPIPDSGGVVWSHQLQVGRRVSVGWASLISHQEDGPLGRITDAGYRLDATGFTTGGVFEATRDLDLDPATYLQLATVWSGDRNRLGPRYPGDKTWRILASKERHNPTHDDNAPFWRGLQPAGFLAWDTVGGQATALLVAAPWLHTTAWNGGRAELFVQDRKGGTLEKLYLRWSRLAETRLAAGDRLIFGGRRLDTLADPAVRDPLEPPDPA
jgi:hypothetical protein